MRSMLLCLSVLALALAGGACKKSDEAAAADICNHKSKCEKEDPMTPEKIEECKAGLADKDCGAAAKAMTECMIAKEACTPEGKSDVEAMMGACGEQVGAYFECMKNKQPPPAP